MTYSKKTYDIEAEVSEIGKTENPVVSAFLAAPPTLTAATAWSDELQSSMTSLINEVIPLPNGTSYATYESISTDENGVVTDITYEDLGSGDILEAYQAQLIADGWTLSSERTDEAGDMMTIRQYQAKGEFVNILLEVVSLDDAVCLICYTLAITVINSTQGGNSTTMDIVMMSGALKTARMAI